MISGQIEMPNALSPGKVWFTSDTHFFHRNVVDYCRRPFATVEEMNEALIARWNAAVHRDGIMFHLGDFCLGEPERWHSILDRLKGRIYLIVGNHDTRFITEDVAARFAGVAIQMLINVNGQKIYLNHFPFLSYSGDNYGTWQLYGHVHSTQQQSNIIDAGRRAVLLPTQYDVGVDNNDYAPISFRQVEAIIRKRQSSIG